MHPRVDRLPQPDPDYRRFLDAVARRNADRVPLIELAVHPEVVAELLADDALAAVHGSADAAVQSVRLLHRLGYDVVKVSAGIPFELSMRSASDASALSSSQRSWQDTHAGCLTSADALAAFAWPAADDVDFSPVTAAADALPEGMRLIGFCGGVLEYATYLVGLERFMMALYDAPDLAQGVIDGVGNVLCATFERYCTLDSVAAIWLGDDLGSKNGTLISPQTIEELLVPWYRKFVAIAHAHDRPFLLHSCGRIDAVMPAMVDDVGIDAKHSFEDTITPVEEFMRKWGDRIAVMGGVDVNLLSLGEEAAIAKRVNAILECGAPTHGYICGSGNSIPNYVPASNYLTMIETVARFNGQL
ncbi:MAG: hypothetical protein H6817_12140 [Phycisphaerales bacterium]|nr:hypothetical protein [Phycisphaerales bacterium]